MGKRGPGARVLRRQPNTLTEAPQTLPEGATRAERVIAFLSGLTVTSGAHAGSKLALRPWQQAAIARIYSTDADGHRPVRTALLSMGRKAGKSTISAALACAHLVGPEAVSRGQVVASAADRNQAGVVYAELRAFVLASPELAERVIFREWNKTAEDTVTGSVFITASSDHRVAHGTSPTVYIADEVAQWRGRELLDALRTGQGAHAEPLGIILSTRSPDPDNPLEELIRYGADVDTGIIEDETFASFVWSAPMDADPWARETWLLANPDADAVRLADIAVQARQAQRLPSQEAAFRAYVLNQPTANNDDRFIGPQDWDACAGTAEAVGPCFGGLDLASGAADLTAFALFWPETGALKVWAFLPTLKLDEKAAEDRAPYRQWQAAGHVVEIPGRAIDRVWLAEWIATTTEGLDLQAISSDRWGLADFQAVLDREGIPLPMQPRGTGYKDASPDITEFERRVLEVGIAHAASPLLRWAVANTVIDTDPAGNRKLAKDRARGRIDPLAAAVQAVGLAGRAPAAPDFSFTGMVLSA